MMQGGGFEKLQFGIAPSICLTVPMEAEIPSLHSVTQVISMLCKKEEVSIDSFVYIKFPRNSRL